MTDQATDLAPSSVSLVIPCRPEYVALCRLVAGALGLRDGLEEEVVADVKVIVTEACNCFLAMAGTSAHERDARASGETEVEAPPACSMRMEFDSRTDAFVISVLYPEHRELITWVEARDPMSEAGLGLTILKALTDEMVEFDTPEGNILRLTKLLPA